MLAGLGAAWGKGKAMTCDEGNYRNGTYIADFEDGTHIERPFVYRAVPGEYDPEFCR